MDDQELYELVYEATRSALKDAESGGEARLLRRFESGKIVFIDGQGREAKEVDVFTLFRKVTSVREKLRVLEQKLNNHGGLSGADKAEMQTYITRCYGSLTTFNFLFADERDKFSSKG